MNTGRHHCALRPITALAAFALLCLLPPGLQAQGRQAAPSPRQVKPEPRRPSTVPYAGIAIDRRTQAAIRAALKYLSAQQNPNGSWSDRVGRKVHYNYVGMEAEHVGVTALAGMAFLASGSVPDQGPYSREVRKALDWILDQVLENGFIAANGSRMYCHAFATLFLAEAYGMTQDEKVRDKLKQAVRLIVKAQNQEGGWRYVPGAQDSDMSVTVCQVLALRGARNAGIQIPRSTIDNAIQYVRESYRPGEGAFDYQRSPEGFGRMSRTSFALTAAGVATLFGAGEYDSPMIRSGLEYLWRSRPPAELAERNFDYYYGQYYAVQAMFQAGGSLWSAWYRTIKDDLLRIQNPDGCWRDLVGANYATAMAAIILQMPYQYLPITER